MRQRRSDVNNTQTAAAEQAKAPVASKRRELSVFAKK
tara:strand:- start:474 stop:584 length:111 start_codon:yes stop_codon:yes gene_type:complete